VPGRCGVVGRCKADMDKGSEALGRGNEGVLPNPKGVMDKAGGVGGEDDE